MTILRRIKRTIENATRSYGKSRSAGRSFSPARVGPATLEKAVRTAYVRALNRLHNRVDAHNYVLDEIGGAYDGSAESGERRRAVGTIIHKLGHLRMRGAKPKLVTYNVHPLDVWGNARDGWQVNDIYPSDGTIEVPEDATNKEIVTALKKEGLIKPNIHASSIEIDGEVGYTMNLEYRGKPAYELRPAR